MKLIYAYHDGKKLTQPQINLLNKLNQDYGVKVDGEKTELVSELVQFVRSCNTGFGPVTYRGKKVTIQTFDRTRYLILDLDSKAYSDFID